MSDAWIDQADNPAMRGTEMQSSNVCGAIAVVNLHRHDRPISGLLDGSGQRSAIEQESLNLL